jgi:hypothetical protein
MGEVKPAVKSNPPWALRLSSHWHSDAPVLELLPWELFLRLEQTPVGFSLVGTCIFIAPNLPYAISRLCPRENRCPDGGLHPVTEQHLNCNKSFLLSVLFEEGRFRRHC